MSEVWSPVQGYEGRYMISNQGRVRALPGRLAGRVLRPAVKPSGYRYVSLSVAGARTNHYVHRLVAAAFCDRLSGQDVVRHRNDDPSDNRAENLEWGTQRDNIHDCMERGRAWFSGITHCKRGHEFDEGNTGWRSDRPNSRYCLTCSRTQAHLR